MALYKWEKVKKLLKFYAHPPIRETGVKVVMTSNQQDVDEPRFRLATFADEPVYLQFSLNGIDIESIVERLDQGAATFVSSKYFDMFYEGQIIGPAVLALQDEGMAVVYPVVKSKNWPVISVQFMEIAEKDRHMISRFLATCSGGMRAPENAHTRTR